MMELQRSNDSIIILLNSANKTKVQKLSLPKLNILYEMEINYKLSLVENNCPLESDDRDRIIVYETENQNDNGAFQLFHIVSCDPEAVIANLLQKNQLNEAADFADRNGISTSLLYELYLINYETPTVDEVLIAFHAIKVIQILPRMHNLNYSMLLNTKQRWMVQQRY
jgi:hypothetical protein